MLSRVADAVYWMGRYLERAENITRLLLVTDDFATETQGFAEDLAQAAWKDVLAILPFAELTAPVSAFAPLSLPYLQAFFVDGRNPYSVHYSLRQARGAGMEADLVVAFLLFDAHSPRSLRATSAAMKDCLDRIGGNGELSPVARLAGKLHADLAYDDERAVRRASLAFLDRVVDAV